MKTNFHNKNYARSLTFKMRLKATQNRPLLRPITTNVNSAMNQSEFEQMHAISVKRGKTRASRTSIGFGLASHWLRKWHELCQVIMGHCKQNQSKPEITFDTQSKTAQNTQNDLLSAHLILLNSVPPGCLSIFKVVIPGASRQRYLSPSRRGVTRASFG